MKVLFIQLSDMHCSSMHKGLLEKVKKAACALKKFETAEQVFIIFTGDLADKADNEEFQIGLTTLNTLKEQLSDIWPKTSIELLLVPGNHDMILENGCRDARTIENWKEGEHLEDEIGRLSGFFSAIKDTGCFANDKIVDSREITVNGIKVTACLINSALYSTRQPEDKQLHYIPLVDRERIDSISQTEGLRIALCHHTYEWFEWDSKQSLERSYANYDIVFTGHDHKSENHIVNTGNGRKSNYIAGGQFNLDPRCPAAFNVVVYDSDTRIAQPFAFDWKVEEQIFIAVEQNAISCTNTQFGPSKEYLQHLLENKDEPGTSLIDYFVFPKLIAHGESFSTDEIAQEIDENELFDIITRERVLKISGRRNSGKTALLKYLYSAAVDKGYWPVLIEKKDYRDSRIEKMLRDLIEDQYNNSPYSFDLFEQFDHQKEIVFIDDIDLIDNEKARTNLVGYILDTGRILIYTTKEISSDLEESVRDRMDGVESNSVEISPFYKVARDSLVEKVCKVKNVDPSRKVHAVEALDYMVQCQANLFSLNPGNLRQYIEFFISSQNDKNRGIDTFTIVFETNIRNKLMRVIPPDNLNIYLAFLEYIADDMYFTKRSEVLSFAYAVK